MLFNSFVFIFGFLPVTLFVTYALGRWRRDAAKIILAVLSLGFYAFWQVKHLPLLLFSIVFNYLVGGFIQRAYERGDTRSVKIWMIFGVTVDVALLGWFKYANFVWDNLQPLVGVDYHLQHIVLPLAISFFTFQKIAYLIDSARGKAKRIRFIDFALFAAFFPQLIAGPIVHYAEIVPQVNARLWGKLISRNVMIGLVIFAIGLFKKTVIADTLATYANTMFDAAGEGGSVGFFAGWTMALTYTLQLYFDFSGYSDMAIGLARMFGVKLPLNFHSPLRATSIIEFWRRWHMTLQRFLYAYVFQPASIPLNRLAAQRGLDGWSVFLVAVFIPSFFTFVVSGIWHGAGWTFVIFGVMHALYVCINEAWREFMKRRRRKARKQKREWKEPGPVAHLGYFLLTVAAVLLAKVVFRSETVADAVHVWKGMFGLGGFEALSVVSGADFALVVTIVIAVCLVVLAPNTQQIMRRFDPAYDAKEWIDVDRPLMSWTWKPNCAGIAFAGLALFLGILFIQRGQAVFLYFNF